MQGHYYKNVTLISHPLAQHKLSILRDKKSDMLTFRKICHEISILLAIEAAKHLPTEVKTVETPLSTIQSSYLQESCLPVVVPVLRAGLSMLHGFLEMMPEALIGFIGLQRDEKTFEAISYYYKVPHQNPNAPVLILDPMLATSGTASAAIELLKKAGFNKISLVTIIAAAPGISHLNTLHPDVTIFTCAIDEKLNDKAFIVPGLGDAGDRFCGTV